MHVPALLAIVTLNLISIISLSSLGVVTSGCTMIVTIPLPLETWTIGTGILTIHPLNPGGTLLLGLFLCALSPFNRCCCISTHFNQCSWVEALVSWSSGPVWSGDTLLTMPALEAYEVLYFSCLCSPSAFPATCIKVM